MRKQYQPFLLALLIPAFLLVSGCAVAKPAPEQGSPAVMATRWSDPATWPDGKVPVAGDKVTIAKGKDVVLDVSPPALHGLTVNGTLSFSNNADLELTTEWVLVRGELEIGSEAHPYTRKATITLTDNVPNEEIEGMGDRGIMVEGGTLSLHGDRKNSWTKLARTAEAGSTSIQVLHGAGWRVGDVIVLASTDFDPHQAERRTIAAIHGNAITLDKKLDYMHFGRITDGVDEGGEVGMLTRNILIQASPDADKTLFGGHVMAMVTSKMYVSGVEFNRMGQNMHLARYPIHWHLVGDGGKGQYIENSSIHDTYSRCVTVHGTNFVRVENNVTYNTIGHCFFLEDGIEHGNQFVHNLGILTKCHPDAPCIPTNLAAAGETRTGSNGQYAKDVLIPSDNTASTFWITNPDNIYLDNVAAGSEQVGFWIALSEHPTGAFEGTAIGAKTWPRRTKILEFKGNTAHSNYDGLIFDRGQDPKGHFNVGGNTNMAYANPEKKTGPLVSVIEDFTGYKNRNSGIWARGELHVFKNLKLADNAIGYTHAYPGLAPGGGAFTSKVIDSLFVGETDNIGNPGTAAEIAYGRSLPKPELADFPIRGYEFYDYLHHVDNVTFRNYEDNATRKTGAISYLMYTSFPINPQNSVEHAKFINAKPVYFPPMERKWGSDSFGSAGYKGAAFHDIDGSVGGIPDSYIVIDNGISDGSDGCEIKPTWRAAVCKGKVGRMNVSSPGRGGFGGAAGAPPARVAAAGPGAVPARGGPAGPGAPGGRRGGFGGFGGGDNQPPIVLSHNGRDFTITGEATVPADTEIKVATTRPKVSLSLRALPKGSWVLFDLPGFTTAASGTQENSLDGLRKAKDTAYFKDQDALWVKIVSTGLPPDGGGSSGYGGGTIVQVSR